MKVSYKIVRGAQNKYQYRYPASTSSSGYGTYTIEDQYEVYRMVGEGDWTLLARVDDYGTAASLVVHDKKVYKEEYL